MNGGGWVVPNSVVGASGKLLTLSYEPTFYAGDDFSARVITSPTLVHFVGGASLEVPWQRDAERVLSVRKAGPEQAIWTFSDTVASINWASGLQVFDSAEWQDVDNLMRSGSGVEILPSATLGIMQFGNVYTGLPWRVFKDEIRDGRLALNFSGGGTLQLTSEEGGGFILAQNAVYVSNIIITSETATRWTFYDSVVSVTGTPKLELRCGGEWISPSSVVADNGEVIAVYPGNITIAEAWRVTELPGAGITFDVGVPLSYTQTGIYP